MIGSQGEKMEDLEGILRWYMLGGVDEICAEKPFDALAKQTPDATKTATPAPTAVLQAAAPQRPATTLLAQSNNSACINAREICASAQTLDELKNAMEKFEGCTLKFSANSTVFGNGSPSAQVMFIGEAPGADEDMQGKPFVGRSGQLLSKMLAAIALKREDCYITNVLPWRPPGNRTPTDGEVAVCLPFLQRQIELVKPKCIFLLGASAANALFDNADSISHLRGKVLDYKTPNGEIIPALCSYHPAYLLRSPQQKSKSWSDLLRLQRKLQEN
ncbi:MAG: uracil-DNA glycosylase [Alphaproteobacteria bacterium]|nr:uracil-DNA glycosylase [Alphaproteobacteria bacterium]